MDKSASHAVHVVAIEKNDLVRVDAGALTKRHLPSKLLHRVSKLQRKLQEKAHDEERLEQMEHMEQMEQMEVDLLYGDQQYFEGQESEEVIYSKIDGDHSNGDHSDGGHSDGGHSDGDHSDDGDHNDGDHSNGDHSDQEGSHADD